MSEIKMSVNNIMNKIISVKKSLLSGIVFNEEINLEILQSLLDATHLLQSSEEWGHDEDYLLRIRKAIRTKNINGVKKDNLQVKYIHSKEGIKNFGRLSWHKMTSLGALRRELRGSLTRNFYLDIDIDNCHPNLINQLLIAFNLTNTTYNKYCENRNVYLQKVMKHHEVNRQQAKELFILTGYNGSYQKWIEKTNTANTEQLEFLKNFKSEAKALAIFFIANNNKLYSKYCKKLHESKQWNKEFSFLSITIQNYERQILEVLYNFYKSKNLIKNNDCILCHDGIMLNQFKNDIQLCEEDLLLNECKEFIFNNTAFNLCVSVKDIDYDYLNELNIETLDITKTQELDLTYFASIKSYELKKKYFEFFCCKVINPQPAYILLDAYKDEISIKRKPNIYDEKQIKLAFKHIDYDLYGTGDKNGKSFKFINKWCEDPAIKVYDRMDFCPYNGKFRAEDNFRKFNLFTGYNTNINSKDFTNDIGTRNKIIQPFLDIVKALCQDNETYFNYFIMWLAQMIQEPTHKLAYCFIIKGNQGTGKGLLIKALKNILGSQHIISSSKPNDFLGEHAEGCVNKILINMNECDGKDTWNYEGLIKSLVSEDKLTINPKYLRPFEISNYARMLITTNNGNPISIDAKTTDRRFIVYESSNKFLAKKYNSKFWAKMFSLIEHPTFISALYSYFNEIELRGYDFARNRKLCLTSAYYDMIKRNIPYHAQFLEEFITRYKYKINNECCIDDLDINIDDDGAEEDFGISENYNKEMRFSRYNIYQDFLKWIKKNRPGAEEKGFKQSNTLFYATLKQLQIPAEYKKTGGQNYMILTPCKVYDFLLKKNWIEKDDLDTIKADEEKEEILADEFKDMFSILN